jgi:hypothetical protein
MLDRPGVRDRRRFSMLSLLPLPRLRIRLLRPRSLLRRPLRLVLLRPAALRVLRPRLGLLLRPVLLGRGGAVSGAVLLGCRGSRMVLVPGDVLLGRSIISVPWLCFFLSLEQRHQFTEWHGFLLG